MIFKQWRERCARRDRLEMLNYRALRLVHDIFVAGEVTGDMWDRVGDLELERFTLLQKLEVDEEDMQTRGW